MAVTGGTGSEHDQGTVLWEMSEQIVAGRTRNVRTTTNNLAELVAFTRALEWARTSAQARGRPICIRYDSRYAAMIASGSWKAKKHKEMAANAREQWGALRKKIGKRLWIRHVKGHSGHRWNHRADRLADDGRMGHERNYETPAEAVD